MKNGQKHHKTLQERFPQETNKNMQTKPGGEMFFTFEYDVIHAEFKDLYLYNFVKSDENVRSLTKTSGVGGGGGWGGVVKVLHDTIHIIGCLHCTSVCGSLPCLLIFAIFADHHSGINP